MIPLRNILPTYSIWERDCQQFLLAKGVASGSSAWVPLGKGTTKKEGKNTLLVSPAQSSSQTLHSYGKIACSSGKLLLGGFFLCRLTCLLQFFNWKSGDAVLWWLLSIALATRGARVCRRPSPKILQGAGVFTFLVVRGGKKIVKFEDAFWRPCWAFFCRFLVNFSSFFGTADA